MKALKLENSGITEVDIENTLEALQAAVDGYISVRTILVRLSINKTLFTNNTYVYGTTCSLQHIIAWSAKNAKSQKVKFRKN